MLSLGELNDRHIIYCKEVANDNWQNELPESNWSIFTIVDDDNPALIKSIVTKSLDKNVTCVSCAGKLASEVEDYFANELVIRNIEKESTETVNDEEISPMLTFHRNFSEGLWFSIYAANVSPENETQSINTIVCVDTTIKGVKQHLIDLMQRFNNGEFPSDEEIELPVYDS